MAAACRVVGDALPPPLSRSSSGMGFDHQVRRCAVVDGPRFVGELLFAVAPTSIGKGMQKRLVCQKRVSFPPCFFCYCAGGSDQLAALEYWADMDPDSVASRLERNLTAARVQQEGVRSDAFQSAMERRLAFVEGAPGLREDFLGNIKRVKSAVMHAGSARSPGRRPKMEDAHVVGSRIEVAFDKGGERVVWDVAYSAVFDGHGGDECAVLAAGEYGRYLKCRLDELVPLGLAGIHLALKVASVDFSWSYLGTSGSTLNCCLEFPDGSLWCGNLGDSRAFLVTTRGSVIPLSEDQKPGVLGSEDEVTRFGQGAVKRGHAVIGGRVDGSLATARSLGDSEATSARSKVTRVDREIVEERVGRELESDEKVYVVMASDGVFDVAGTEQVGAFVYELLLRKLSLSSIAAEVIKAAYQAGSKDNMTCIIRETRIRRRD